ncbi:MAG: histidine--tRNA ligase [Bacteroidales bacterium]|jgi:histidyl-tRNA synthetase|nr:histidine--tRNA ligase [Bacteroidales bacterium]
MIVQKPSIPKGTRDFSPAEMVRRKYIFNTIEQIFQRFGFMPIETPAMENLSSLTGKYGEEGDRLLFRILNSGNYLNKVSEEIYQNKNSSELSRKICEKGLRYDLTVPFARYVVQNMNEITFPFKRYQIQPVWRADKPQKGRYREFYQCDVDVIGNTSLLNETELIQIIDSVFNNLSLNVVTKINNRKVLSGIAEVIGAAEKFTDITVAIDKLDKIGIEKVKDELLSKDISKDSVDKLEPILNYKATSKEKKILLKDLLKQSEIGTQGINEIEEVFSYFNEISLKMDLEFDITLARGLNYYTGAIFEVQSKDMKFGSICGGGRYDNLTGVFGLNDMSGVGVSFGADRIYDVIEKLNLFPNEIIESSKVMFVNFGSKEERYCLPMLAKLRDSGVNAEIYPSAAKMKKQMTYANKKNIPYVVLVGENEIKEKLITIKDMHKGDQTEKSFDEFLNEITE